MRWFGVFLLFVAIPCLDAQGLDGLWVLHGPGPETVYRFSTLTTGETVAEVAQRGGADASTRYFCRNQQFSGLPLLNHVWLWGLRPGGPGRWIGGLAVDLRNDHGNLYYCEATLEDNGTRLVLRSLSGLADEDRTQVFSPWSPLDVTPVSPPQGNLMESFWAENPEVVGARERAKPRPILSPTADALVWGFFYYGAFAVVVLTSVLFLLSR